MKTIKLCFATLVATILLSSCEKETLPEFPPEEPLKLYSETAATTEAELSSIGSSDYTILASEEEFAGLVCLETIAPWQNPSYTHVNAVLNYYSTFNYVGATFEGAGITISIYDYDTRLYIYEETFTTSDPFYWGVITDRQVNVIVTSDSGFIITNGTLGRSCGDTPLAERDEDGDGINDDVDNCAINANPDQGDLDNDGIGDLCDTDADGDGSHLYDNCPMFPNPDQSDYDLDELGDACDADDDNDGVPDTEDGKTGSNEELTIVIGYCNTGIENKRLPNGVTMADLVDELESGEYKNLGQEIKSYTELANYWVNQEIITADQKIALLACAQEE